MSSVWEKVKDLINERTGLSFEILDLLAVNEILLQCVQGLSVTHIARYIEQDEQYVRDVLMEFLDFGGWEVDLDFSPIVVYNRCVDKKEFINDVDIFSPFTYSDDVSMSYDLCEKYKILERKLENDGNSRL